MLCNVFRVIVTMINYCVLCNINLFIGVEDIKIFLSEMFFFFNFYNDTAVLRLVRREIVVCYC